jgi:hypothetical protein
VSHHEVGGIALSVVAVLLAELETRDIRGRQKRDFVSDRFEGGANQPFVLPGEATKKNRDTVALRRGERSLDRTPKMRRHLTPTHLLFEPPPLGRDPLVNFVLELLLELPSRFHHERGLLVEAGHSAHEALPNGWTQTVKRVYTNRRVFRHM